MDAVTSGRDAQALLEVSGLTVTFERRGRAVVPVKRIDLRIHPGETIALVGESGSGKSLTALAIMGLLKERGGSVAGSVMFEGDDLLRVPAGRLREIRGSRVAIVFQDPLSSLNPVLSVGTQLSEAIETHKGLDRTQARTRALELLSRVGIADPDRRIDQYPHELSGGMRQRVMIAIALSGDPALLIADEPTTALDVTIQAGILELLRDLRTGAGLAILLITHDLGIVAGFADRTAIMYAGEIVETGPTATVLTTPDHPYTAGLLASVPRLDQPRRPRLDSIPGVPPDPGSETRGCPFAPRCAWRFDRCDESKPPLLSVVRPEGPSATDATGRPDLHRAACFLGGIPLGVGPPDVGEGSASVAEPGGRVYRGSGGGLVIHDLRVYFPVTAGILRRQQGAIHAVDGVSLTIPQGRTLGLVGESGCGKTTVGRAVVRILEPTTGSIVLDGTEITVLHGEALRGARRRFQLVFQDAHASLDHRQTIGQALSEPLDIHDLGVRDDRGDRVTALLGMVGLEPWFAERYPHELSGGQRQRVGIARALAVEPSLLVCDEPISSLDVSIRAQVVNLLVDLQRRLGLTYLFIAHDLAVIRHMADDVAVMYLGRIMETGPADQLFADPRHPYTIALLSAVPSVDPRVEREKRRIVLLGDVPSPEHPPPGCPFSSRCWLRTRLGDPERCTTEAPLPEPGAGPDMRHLVACHFSDDARALRPVDVASPVKAPGLPS